MEEMIVPDCFEGTDGFSRLASLHKIIIVMSLVKVQTSLPIWSPLAEGLS